jgi:HEAT repeat protein
MAVTERYTRRGSEREAPASSKRSKRERQEWARQKIRKMIPIAVLLGVAAVGGVGLMVPGWIRKARLNELHNGDAFARERAAVNLAAGGALGDLLAKVKAGKFEEAGGAAAMALARSGPPGVEQLAVAAGAEALEARLSAAYGLGLSRSPAAVEPLAKLLVNDKEKAVRLEAARALGMIRAPAAVKALVAQAQAESEVRAVVCESLLSAATGGARGELVAGLGASTEEMRRACALALMAVEASLTAEDVKRLAGSEIASARAGAVGLLSMMPDGPFDEIIPKALEDESELVRSAAADAVGMRRWEKAAPLLEKLVLAEEEKAQVKASACRALGRLGKLSSAMPLAKCLADAYQMEAARVAAAQALVAVGRRHKFERLTAKGEFNDHPTHLKLALKSPDVRWEVLKVLAEGCASFKGEKMTEAGFQAMGAMAGRKLAPKADVWQAWMTKKLEEGKALGEIYYLVDAAYKLGKNNDQARPLVEKALDLARGLRLKSEPDDEAFFGGLFADICAMLGLDPKKAMGKTEPPPEAKAPATEGEGTGTPENQPAPGEGGAEGGT